MSTGLDDSFRLYTLNSLKRFVDFTINQAIDSELKRIFSLFDIET
ncbi:MAG: hypothetical protein ACXADA_22560 [Candidatus Hodarchaeales archaeon]|jgi:hypothetical protein